MSMLSKYFPTSTKIRQLFPFLKVDRPTELGRLKPLDNSSQLNRRIDMANEDIKHRAFPEEMKVECFFVNVDDDPLLNLLE